VSEDIHSWEDRITRVIHAARERCVDRVIVVGETASTQDSARRISAGKPGLLVVAARQTHGRGRLGRAWADTSHLGVAATFVLAGHDGPWLSVRAGLAACMTVEAMLGRHDTVGVRWPNDVVERASGRKIAGVLVEATDGLFYVGIGINVRQDRDDWSAELRERAVSLLGLGADATRINVIEQPVLSLDGAMKLPAEETLRAWRARDVLAGTRRTFEHDGTRVTGVVEGVEPLGALRVRVEGGRVVSLPALTTSLVHE
jgi:BirA family biotin operon repressor/biotin-[acetyl-CoA-carboxylase] ligase